MIDGYKELTPVIYGENAIKYLYTEQKKAEGEICFLLHWHDRMELTYVTEGTLRFVTEGEEFLVSVLRALETGSVENAAFRKEEQGVQPDREVLNLI